MRWVRTIFAILACLSGLLLLALVIFQIPDGIFIDDLWGSILRLSGGLLLLAIGVSILVNYSSRS